MWMCFSSLGIKTEQIEKFKHVSLDSFEDPSRYES